MTGLAGEREPWGLSTEVDLVVLSSSRSIGWNEFDLCWKSQKYQKLNSYVLITCQYNISWLYEFSCFGFPAIFWDSPFIGIFLWMWPFFSPTIEVVTFCLHGWWVLGVSFLPTIHPSATWMLGSFESVRRNACVHRLDLNLYSHPKEF